MFDLSNWTYNFIVTDTVTSVTKISQPVTEINTSVTDSKVTGRKEKQENRNSNWSVISVTDKCKISYLY